MELRFFLLASIAMGHTTEPLLVAHTFISGCLLLIETRKLLQEHWEKKKSESSSEPEGSSKEKKEDPGGKDR